MGSHILLALIGCVVMCAAVACTGGRTVADVVRRAALYGSDASTSVRPSDVFCGNRVKGPDRGCDSKATGPNGNEPAYEHVEIRGWVVGIGGFDGPGSTPEDEFRFDILLDHGWTPASPAAERVRPINTPQEINFATTPHNYIAFGNGDAAPGSFQLTGLGPAGSGAAKLTRDGVAWGGSRAAVIHVEVNGWGAARMGANPAPSDWVRLAHATRGTAVGWPFDPQNPPGLHPGPLQLGDYMRLVGTLWEDEPHVHDGGNGGNDGKDAKDCWNSGSTGQGRFGRGFFEVHPVDYLARVDRLEASSHAGKIEVIAMCGTGTVTRYISPPGSAPSPPATIGVEEFVDGAFTVWRSVKTQNRWTVRSDNVVVLHVEIEGGGIFGHGAKFKAT
jgi:hypothetical protein